MDILFLTLSLLFMFLTYTNKDDIIRIHDQYTYNLLWFTSIGLVSICLLWSFNWQLD